MPIDLRAHRLLIRSLLQGKLLSSMTGTAQLVETHISSVIITEEYVYKLKKPLNLGFLDFSTLQRRRFYCEEELRLNKRLSPTLYVDVVALYGTVEQPVFEEAGPVLEYLVRMRPFPQQAQMDRLLQRGELSGGQLCDLAVYIADFHASASVATARDHYGEPPTVARPVQQNFSQIAGYCDDPAILARLQSLSHWSERTLAGYRDLFQQRKADGFVRECHGDLHLRNLAWVDDGPLAFDCIEFDPDLYWIDVINDIAFLLMDLRHQQRPDLARLFLNRYLERSGDYAGLALLPFYLLYRAMVKAKVAIITAHQAGIPDSERDQALQQFDSYLALGEALVRPSRPSVFIMHGPSGSGKSTLSRQLSRLIDAIVLRSDVERKRLLGMDSGHNAAASFQQGIYSEQATRETYRHLLALSERLLQAGYSVIVDATFNRAEQRQPFASLAQRLCCPYRILDLKLSPELLRQRLLMRVNDASDADISVLQRQLEQWQPLTPEESAFVTTLDMEEALTDESLLALLPLQVIGD